jgi:hypothetical protein
MKTETRPARQAKQPEGAAVLYARRMAAPPYAQNYRIRVAVGPERVPTTVSLPGSLVSAIMRKTGFDRRGVNALVKEIAEQHQHNPSARGYPPGGRQCLSRRIRAELLDKVCLPDLYT